MASVSTMKSVIDKLTSLLSDEYKHLKDVKKGIRWLVNELSTINDALKRLADMEEDHQIHEQTKEWRNKVRELSYDIEDCVDRYVDSLTRGDAKANFARKAVRNLKQLWKNHQTGNEIQELMARVVEELERRDRYKIDELISMRQSQSVPLDPRAPALYEEAKNLVGIDEPREQIIGWIKGEEKQLKVVSIFGTGGLGKTTLAMEVYRKIDESFDCRASVSVSRTPDMKRLLRDILSQINESMYYASEKWELEQLIRKLREYLEDKRYFIIIDDIWSIEAWKYVKSALPDNNNRSRIVTTTRKKNVAQSCCIGVDEHIYEALPLSDDDSARLFFRRISCSSEELIEVAKEILRKCGGLPLAIISIAGLLANKNPTLGVWTKIRNSISSAIENDSDSTIDSMKKILFLSYFDLPHHLKPCLLYLSVFPEDYSIDCRHLIWSWAAEGFIPGQNRGCMEQLGESYLHELINRSMIQPTKIKVDGSTVKFCRVHDVILDFIVSKAAEENFVTILNGNDSCDDSSNKIRRLSLQPPLSEDAKIRVLKAMKNQSHLRSFRMFGSPGMPVFPDFSKCQVMRVLDIDDKYGHLENSHLEHIGNFCLLKYLRIKRTFGGILELPEQIGKLQHLETLDLKESPIEKLPASIVQLQKLVRLFIEEGVPLPDGIGNLQALEKLSYIDLDIASLKSIQGLGELTKLRKLSIGWPKDKEKEKVCISSITKLLNCSLRSLKVYRLRIFDFIDSWIKSCGSPPPLRRLMLHSGIGMPTMPSQIGLLVNLTHLHVRVDEVGGLENLASLPRLLSLTIITDGAPQERQVIIRQKGFQHLLEFGLLCWCTVGLKFEAGAMQKLQRLKVELWGGNHSLGLHHLLGLKSVEFTIECLNAYHKQVESLEDEIRGAVVAHPNRPVLTIQRINRHLMLKPNKEKINNLSLERIDDLQLNHSAATEENREAIEGQLVLRQ